MYTNCIMLKHKYYIYAIVKSGKQSIIILYMLLINKGINIVKSSPYLFIINNKLCPKKKKWSNKNDKITP